MKIFILVASLLISLCSLSQNVGIGTISPQAKLHVFSTTNTGVLSETNGASQYAGFEAKTNAGVNDNLMLRKWMPGSSGSIAGINLDNLGMVVTGAQAGPLLVGAITANPIYFTTSNVERMRVTAVGNIGIGTGIPDYSLHIARSSGEASIGINTAGTATQALLNLSTGDRIGGNSLILLKYPGTAAGTIAGAPKANLSLIAADAGATGLLVSTNQASPIYFATNTLQRMRIESDGKIGVNDNLPSSLFSVKGRSDVLITAKFDDVATTGKRGAVLGFINTTDAGSTGVSGTTFEGGAVSFVEPVTYGVLGQSGLGGIAVGAYSTSSTALRGKSTSGFSLYTSGKVRMDGIGEGAGKVLTSNAAGDATWATLPSGTGTWTVNGNNIYNNNSGYVGINDNSPAARLDIRNPTTDTLALNISYSGGFRKTEINGLRQFYHEGDFWVHSAYGKLRLGYADKGWYWGTINGGRDLQLFSHSTSDLNASRVIRMLVNGTTGNVGIGLSTLENPEFGKLIVDRNGDLNGTLGGYFGVITGLNSSVTDGSGIYGISSAPRTGAQSYAGVSGYNSSTSTDRFGVIGTSSGTTSGSVYSAGVGGYGDYGVLGYSQSSKGAGIIAQHASGLTALEVNNGFIKATGTTNNKTAFTITATAINSSGYILNLSYANQNASDILIVTHNYNPPGAPTTYLTVPFSVYWDGSSWAIYLDDKLTPIIKQSFNVLVIKQ